MLLNNKTINLLFSLAEQQYLSCKAQFLERMSKWMSVLGVGSKVLVNPIEMWLGGKRLEVRSH